MTRSLAAVALAAAIIAAPSAGAEDPHAAWDDLLARYVTVAPESSGANLVDYAALADSDADRARLEAYIADLAAAEPSTMPRNDQYAYWANLYNALTVQVIIEAYPVESIRRIRSRGAGLSIAGLIGPWKTKLVTVEGERLSLDDIEHAIMRPTYGDPLVHYAVNCASIGCPNLKPTAWRGETLEVELEAAARAYVNDPRGVALRDNGIEVSRIYKWFREDFGGSNAGVIAHLLQYADPALAEAIRARPRVVGHAYDWGLNDAGAGDPATPPS